MASTSESDPLRDDSQQVRDVTNSRPKNGLYFGVPNGVDVVTWWLLGCTCLTLCLTVVLIPLITYFSTQGGDCDASLLEGETAPFGGQLLPHQPTLIERYSDYSATNQLFDVYDNSSSATVPVGYFFSLGYFSWVRLGYADEANRPWFQARFSSFLSRWKPFTEFDLVRCDADDGEGDAPFRVVEGYFEGDWFCYGACERVFHVYKRDDAGGYVELATASFESLAWDELSDPYRRMNMTGSGVGGSTGLLASAKHYRGAMRTGSRFASANIWEVDVSKADDDFDPADWVIATVVALDDLTTKSFMWLWFIIFGSATAACCFAMSRAKQKPGYTAVA